MKEITVIIHDDWNFSAFAEILIQSWSHAMVTVTMVTVTTVTVIHVYTSDMYVISITHYRGSVIVSVITCSNVSVAVNKEDRIQPSPCIVSPEGIAVPEQVVPEHMVSCQHQQSVPLSSSTTTATTISTADTPTVSNSIVSQGKVISSTS